MGYYRSGRQGMDAVWFLIIVNALVYVFTLLIGAINPFFYNTVCAPLTELAPASILIHPWTIITHMFLHASPWHILFNMLALYFFGEFLASIIGERRFLLVYFIGGIIGGLFYVLFAYTVLPGLLMTSAVGASGAVFAVEGALVALRPNERVMMFPLPIPLPLWVAILISFLIISPGTAWEAHLGGALAGLAIGYFFKHQRRY
jgi:uncharacterized protein